jgi:hypothetical protein
MRLSSAAAVLCSALLLAGCATGNTTSAGPTPTANGLETSTPTATPTPADSTAAPIVVDPAQPPQTGDDGLGLDDIRPDQPAPLPLGPNDVDPAGFTSHAVDDAGQPLPGVEFMTADGQIICGIADYRPGSQPGDASCTPATYLEIIPQPGLDTLPPVMSIYVSAVTGSSYLYPDWFAKPARTIPVLPDGKTIRYQGTTCSVAGGAVTCSNDATGKGFIVSTTQATLF